LASDFTVYRSRFHYWAIRKKSIKPERLKQFAMVKYAQELSNGSADARTAATISTTEGLPMSRYVARKACWTLI